MKLIASGVTFSAAIMRSPSFSRSSSSTMTIMRPSCISAIASSIVANCIWLQQAFYILCQDIELQVHRIFRPGCPQVRIFERIWNYCDRKHQPEGRSEEHTSELQSHSNISYAVFCLKKKKKKNKKQTLSTHIYKIQHE